MSAILDVAITAIICRAAVGAADAADVSSIPIGADSVNPTLPIVIMVLMAVLSLELVGNASLAKLLLGLRIRSVTGHRAGFAQRMLRWLIKTTPPWLMAALVILDDFGSAPQSRSSGDASAVAKLVVAIVALMIVAFSSVFGRSGAALWDRLSGTQVYTSRAGLIRDEAARGFEPFIGGG